jgi:hypothetical protein
MTIEHPCVISARQRVHNPTCNRIQLLVGPWNALWDKGWIGWS